MRTLSMKHDWIEATSKTTSPETLDTLAQANEWLVALFKSKAHTSKVYLDVAKRRSNGYRYAFTDGNDGATWELGAQLAVQGYKVQYTGLALRDRAVSSARLANVLEWGMKPVRIDFAFDVMEAGTTVDELAMKLVELSSGGNQTVRYIQSSNGSTVYVGSPTSPVQLRVYDKGAQTGRKALKWMRYELQCRHAAAVAFASAPISGFAAAAEKVVALLDGHGLEFAELTFELRNEAVVPSYTPPRPESNRKRWFWTQVYPAAIKWSSEHPGEFVDFLTALNAVHFLNVDIVNNVDYDTEIDE